MSAPYLDQPRAIVAGVTYPGALLYFSEAGTTAPLVQIYADPHLLTPLPNPLAATAGARWPAIYLDADAYSAYRARGVSADGNSTLFDDDNINPDMSPYARAGAALDDAARPLEFATLEFFGESTSTKRAIYATNALEEELPNPVTADINGLFDPIWMDNTSAYRVIQRDANGVLIYDIGYLSGVSLAAPGPPVLSGSLVSGANELTWTPAAQGSFVVAFYLLERQVDGGGYSVISTSSADDPLAYSDSDIESEKIYDYRVRAQDSEGNLGAYSNVIEISVPMLDPYWPYVVALLTANTGELVEWTGVPNVSAVTGVGSSSGISSVQAKFDSSSYFNQKQFVDHTNYVLMEDDEDLDRFSFPGEFTFEGWFYLLTVVSADYITLMSNLVGAGLDGLFVVGYRGLVPVIGLSNFQDVTIAGVPGSFNQNTTSGSELSAGQWYHIAVTRDVSSNIRLFINGVAYLLGTQAGGPVGGISLNGTSCFTAAQGIAFQSADFNGYFDQIRATKACRYTADFTPPTEPFPTQG